MAHRKISAGSRATYKALLQILPDDKRVLIKGYKVDELGQSERRYAELERAFDGTNKQAVLVATSSVKDLKKDYPNYFADTSYFTGPS